MIKVKLKKAKVFNGSVWPVDSVVELADAEAQKLIDADEAERFTSAPVAAPAKDKEK